MWHTLWRVAFTLSYPLVLCNLCVFFISCHKNESLWIFVKENMENKIANPPLIPSRLYCAEVYYNRTSKSVKYKCKSIWNSAARPSPVSSPCKGISDKLALLVVQSFAGCSLCFPYFNPKTFTQSYVNQTLRHLRICHIHSCQTSKPLIAWWEKLGDVKDKYYAFHWKCYANEG